MRAITLWQPWASLVAHGLKEYETRSWGTTYRGPLAIHAAKRKPESVPYHIPWEIELPLGVVLCYADLVACVPTESISGALSAEELQYGDFTPGRFAWRLNNIRNLLEPVPAVGKQGFWDWKPS